MAKLQQQEIENARSDIVKVIESYGIVLEKSGKEYRALCPFHSEKSASFTVMPVRGRYCCFGCGAQGDSIQFVMDYVGVGLVQAVNMINGVMESPDIVPRERVEIERDTKPEWTPVDVVPADAPQPMDVINRKIGGVWTSTKASYFFEYKNKYGKLIGYVYRFDMPDGGKEVLPQTWCVNEDGELSWRWQSFTKPRPIFGLDKLHANPTAQVLVVEGEKTAVSAQKLFLKLGIGLNKLVVVSWIGGSHAIKYIDWSPIFNRRIALWPDADQKDDKDGNRIPFMEQIGTVAMIDIYQQIGSPEDTKFIIPPPNVPDGWDLGDKLPDGFDLLQYMKTAVKLSEMNLYPVKKTPALTLVTSTPSAQFGAQVTPIKPPVEPQDEHSGLENNYWFKILGYDHTFYYFMQYEKGQVLNYTKGDFSESGLIELAPLDWWEQNFGRPKGGVNKGMAMNWIVRIANSKGIYDLSRLRGRGAWIDKCSKTKNNRIIFHHGHYLTVDGVKMSVKDVESKYVYETRKRLPTVVPDALTDEDGKMLLEIASMFRWTKPASAALMAGWIALAPICGAIKWRPHIWLNGGAGAGKSTLLNDFIHQLLNGIDLYVQGSSSEAGIRQELKGDALPVLLEESESNTEKESLRIQSILALIRQASTESQAKTLKGTSGGVAISFHIRSMFCLASIQVGLKQQADMERMTVLTLRPKHEDNNSAANWKIMLEKLTMIRKDDTLASRLVRRSLNLLPITLKNIDTFAEAASIKFNSQREGDQYGALLAGAWSMISSNTVTVEEALGYINLFTWDEYREHTESDDSSRALMTLMGSMVRADGYAEITINELIRIACGKEVNGVKISMTSADAVLQRYGMRVDDAGKKLMICNTHPQLKELMHGTPFESDLKGALLRLKGAKRIDKVVRWNGVPNRGYSISITDLIGDEEVNEKGEVPF